MLFIPESPPSARYLGTQELWEVRKKLVTKREAQAAGLVALGLTRASENLKSVSSFAARGAVIKNSHIFAVGIGDPETSDPSRTIYGTPALRSFCAPLIHVIDKVKTVFPNAADADIAYIRALAPGQAIPRHDDKLGYPERVVTNLIGLPRITLVDPEQGEVRFVQFPGDAYALRPDPDTGRSIEHEVSTLFGVLGVRVSMMLE